MKNSSLSFLSFLLWTAMLASLPSLAFCQDDDSKPPPTASQQIGKLKSELSKAIRGLQKEMRAAEDEDAIQAVIDKRRSLEKAAATEIVALTSESDNDTKDIQALAWLVTKTKGESRQLAFDTLIKDHIDSSKLVTLASQLGRPTSPEPQIEMMLRQLIENASDVKVKATATLGLVGLIEKLADLSDSDIERYSKRIGEKFEAYAEKYSDGKADEEINRLLQLCVDEYSDVKGRGRQTIGELAAMQLQAMNLKVGRVAPDIIGEDLDGVSFKLSDYRGKVVMLDFWGDW